MIRRFLSGSLAVALFVGVVAGPAAASTPQWKIVASPNIGDDANGFADVARIPGTKRFWAVGAGTDIFEWTPHETLIARWNGYAWKLVPSPNVGDQDNFLTGVSVRSTSNAWAVGAAEDAAEVDKTLIEHWNGRAWKVVPSPNEGTAGDAMSGRWATARRAAPWPCISMDRAGRPSRPPTWPDGSACSRRSPASRARTGASPSAIAPARSVP